VATGRPHGRAAPARTPDGGAADRDDRAERPGGDGIYQAAQQVGLAIPQDLSVVSFDDSDIARWLNPGLSSLAIPHYEMGRRAVDILLDGSTDNRIERRA
jgi:hypothetical protein